MLKSIKMLMACFVALFASVVHSATVFYPTDTNINFILETGDLTNATIAIFDEVADINSATTSSVGSGLEVTVPELIAWDSGAGTLTGSNGSLAIDGDFVIAAICSLCGNVWTGGDIDYGSELTVPGADTYAIVFDGISGFELTADLSPVPVPGAVWLFGSGLLGLVGVARRKKS